VEEEGLEGPRESKFVGDSASAKSLSLVGDTDNAESVKFFPNLRFREAWGSLIKMHSRPRDAHLEQGCSKLHLTFDSAHACVGHS
jgi:hypothetical protein